MRQKRGLSLIALSVATFCVYTFTFTSPWYIQAETVNTRTEGPEFTVTYSADTSEKVIFTKNVRNITALAYFDVTAKYKILPHVQLATQWEMLKKRPLCVAVQSSLDHANILVELATNWPGIINLALFVPGPEFPLALYYLEYLKHCFPFIEERVNVHFAYPLQNQFEGEFDSTLYTTMMQWDCTENPENSLKYLLNLRPKKIMEWRKKLLYPQNMLRNVARDHCQNEWITCVDMDMLFPSPDNGQHRVAESLEQFLNSSEAMSCKNCAFVLPTYEIQSNVTQIPRNKTELLQFVRAGKARQFHKATYPQGQEMSDLRKWERLKPSTKVSKAYPAKPFKWKYEPIYIAKRGTPRFDERYVGYGTVRVAQSYEMFLADYKFHILNNVFLIHRGFKNSGYINRERRKQMQRNWNEFRRHHLKELVIKYDKDPLKLMTRYGKTDQKDTFQITLRNVANSVKSASGKKSKSVTIKPEVTIKQ